MAASRTRLWDAPSSAACSALQWQRLSLSRQSLRYFTTDPKSHLRIPREHSALIHCPSRSPIMTRNESNQVQAIASMPDPTPPRRGRIIMVGIACVLCVAYAVLEGIHSRVEAKADLRQVAMNSAIPFVNVVYPKSGAEGEEIELPGNTQAFTDTPIYARTNGYVKHWYVDIGARVKRSQLLAVIETPELDQ